MTKKPNERNFPFDYIKFSSYISLDYITSPTHLTPGRISWEWLLLLHGRLLFYNMKDLQKSESLEETHARLTKEHEKLVVNYQITCQINEMWRKKVEEMEKRRNELLKLKAEREKAKEESTLTKDSQ